MKDKENVADTPRMKWNDIRRIGPLLIVALAAVVMINPSFVTERNSVGGLGEGDCVTSVPSPDDLKLVRAADAEDDSPPYVWYDPCTKKETCADRGLGELPNGDCCLQPELSAGVILDCPDTDDDGAEGEEPESSPAVKLPPPPAPIIGPIWLGAIDVDASVPGLVTLTFPDLLDAFIEDNIVRVYDADNVMVFEGHISGDKTIVVFSDNAPMLVKTTLTTRAPYYETVGASTTP